MRRPLLAPSFGLALALACRAAVADDVPSPLPAPQPPTPAVAADAEHGAERSAPHSRKPIVVGLIAAGFLILAGAAGANDKPSRKPSKPPPAA